MNVLSQRHPSHEQLLAFAHGKLADDAFALVETHLAQCESCLQWVTQQPDTALLLLAREVATVGVQAEQTQVDSPGDEIPEALRQHPRYRVLQRIGSGGMGTVYKAEHRLMQRTVALKIVHPALVANPQAIQRFEREVRLAAKLSHPNIVISYDADQVADLHILVMEYVDGETLDQRIATTGPVSVAQASEWIRQAALALQHAHEQGMAHRDIKPHNLMIARDGQLRILDFGLSRLVRESVEGPIESAGDARSTAQTRADVVLGTPDYIAPEQIADSRGADIRADIYSLGCTLFFLLTGRAPFASPTIAATLRAQQTQPLPALSTFRDDVPPALAQILACMTAKSPEARYATPGEVAADLAALATPTPAESTVPTAPTSKPILRQRVRWLVGAGVVLLLLFALAKGSGYFTVAPITPPAETPILVLMPSEGLWFPDYQELVNAAPGAKAKLTFASASDTPSKTLHTSIPGIAVPDVKIDSQLHADDYQAIVFIGYDTLAFLPGGPLGSDTDRLLNEFQMQKKTVAALCAGQRVLAQHGALRGKRVSPCSVVRDDEITVDGGTRGTEPVIADGLVVTAAEASYAPEFLQAVVKMRQP